MSIQNKRLERATERILKEELQKGNLPTSKEFAWRMNEYLNEQDLSRPEFVFQAVKNGTLAYASKYNKDFERIYNDLSILYENIREVHEALGKQFSRFEIEKSTIEKEIFQIENSLREKILLYAQGGFLTAVFDVFDTFNQFDKEKSNNVLMDTTRHEVRLVEEMTLSKRIGAPSKTTFSLLGSFQKKETKLNGTIEDIHNVFADKTWQTLIQTKDRLSITGQLLLTYNDSIDMNQLNLSLMTIRPVVISIEYTGDGINWSKIPYNEADITTASGIDLKFPMIQVKKMRIHIKKAEFDEQVPDDEGYDYRYLFGIKNLEMRNLRFPEEGVFLTTPLKVDGPENYRINKVALDVDEVIPTGTDIFYEVALNNAELDWRGISPLKRENPAFPQYIDFQNITRSKPTTMEIGGALALNQYELEELRTNGIQFYRIGTIEGRNIIEGSERLFVGRNAWECKYFEYEYEDHDTHVPSLEDWKEPPTEIQFEYEIIDETRKQFLFEGKNGGKTASYYCRSGVFYSGDQSIFSISPSSTDAIALFINGEKVFEGYGGNQKVNIQFNQGWNEIVVLVYGKNRKTVNGMTVSLDIDMLGLFDHMYVSPTPMTKVELFDLRFNTKMTDRSKYSVRKGEKGYEVILNYAEKDLVFDFYYDYGITGSDGDKEILLRATFKREGSEEIPSPVLKRYRIQFS